MTLAKLKDKLSLSVLCPPPSDERVIHGVYTGDLLSRAMSRVKQDDLWITIMPNKNVIAVAELTDAAAVVLAEDVTLLPDARSAAEENGIAVFSSTKTAFELCRDVADALRELA